MEFVRFTENNDWEGESWNFWLQVDGNQDQLKRLKELADETCGVYELDLDETRTEDYVDLRVKDAWSGYNCSDNKVVGTLQDLPEVVDWDYDDPFYKGRIEEFFLG